MATSEAAARPYRASGIFRLYMFGWAVLSMLALAYLGTTALRPELIAEWLPAAASSDPDAGERQRASAYDTAELQMLQQTITTLQRDFSQLKTTLADQEQREKALLGKLATLEERQLGPAAPVAQATPSPPPAPAAKVAAAKASEPRARVVAAPAPTGRPAAPGGDAAAKPTILNAGATGALATGSIPPASTSGPISFGSATVIPAGQPVGIRLAPGPSPDALRLNWSVLSDRHKDELRGLEPRYVASGIGGPASYQLWAGPLPSAEEATRVCAALREKRVACSVGRLAGESL